MWSSRRTTSAKRDIVRHQLGLGVCKPAIFAFRARFSALYIATQDALLVHCGRLLVPIFLSLLGTHARMVPQRVGAPVAREGVRFHEVKVALGLVFEIAVAHQAGKTTVPKGRVHLVLVHVQPPSRREMHPTPVKGTNMRNSCDWRHWQRRRRPGRQRHVLARLDVIRRAAARLKEELVIRVHRGRFFLSYGRSTTVSRRTANSSPSSPKNRLRNIFASLSKGRVVMSLNQDDLRVVESVLKTDKVGAFSLPFFFSAH